MDLNGVGWLTAIVVGGFSGWLAERFMKSNMGLLMNIILGIAGAALFNFVLGLAHVSTGSGLTRYLIVSFIGGCFLIGIARFVRR